MKKALTENKNCGNIIYGLKEPVPKTAGAPGGIIFWVKIDNNGLSGILRCVYRVAVGICAEYLG